VLIPKGVSGIPDFLVAGALTHAVARKGITYFRRAEALINTAVAFENETPQEK